MTDLDQYLAYDSWLANILNKDVYRLQVNETLVNRLKSNETEQRHLVEHWQAKPVFVYGKVSTGFLDGIRVLEKLKFNLIDTNIMFDKPVSPVLTLGGRCEIRFARPEDRSQVMDLARRNFTYSRFHLDQAISPETADLIKAEWAGNYFVGKRGQQMVVALVEETMAGFLQLFYDAQTLIIDLIAVDKAQRRRNIAKDMITYAEVNCGEFKQVRVGTQIANIPSMRLYETIGFRVASTQYIFHYHNM